ncbi:hypothetical protein [Psychromicrobium xiongbiense]|nr:hypothetical protein [Psychromicrobium sp. YIM S02556]
MTEVSLGLRGAADAPLHLRRDGIGDNERPVATWSATRSACAASVL